VPRFYLHEFSTSKLTDISVYPSNIRWHPESKIDVKTVKSSTVPLLILQMRRHLLLSVHLLHLLLLLIRVGDTKPHLKFLLLLLLVHLIETSVLLLEFEVLLALSDLLLELAIARNAGVVRHMAMANIHVWLLLVHGVTLVKENSLVV